MTEETEQRRDGREKTRLSVKKRSERKEDERS